MRGVIELYSELRKLLKVFIVVSVIIVFCSIISLVLLYDNRDQSDFEPLLFIYSYLIVSVPFVFISLTVVLNKIIRILTSKDIALIERFREIENEQK